MNENTTAVAMNETVAPVAVETTVAPVAVETTVAKAKKEVIPMEKIEDAVCSIKSSDVAEIIVGKTAVAKALGVNQQSVNKALNGEDPTSISDNTMKVIGKNVGDFVKVVMMVSPAHFASASALATTCNSEFLGTITEKIVAAGAEKVAKGVEAEAAKVQKDIEKAAKAAQKVIDDAEKAAKKALKKQEEAEAAAIPAVDAGTLDVSGLFVGEEEVAPVAVVEADPILAAALAAAQTPVHVHAQTTEEVNANVQAFADAEAPLAMAAE